MYCEFRQEECMKIEIGDIIEPCTMKKANVHRIGKITMSRTSRLRVLYSGSGAFD